MKYKIGDTVRIKKQSDCVSTPNITASDIKAYEGMVTICKIDRCDDSFRSEGGKWYLFQWIDGFQWIDESDSDLPRSSFELSDGTELEGWNLGEITMLDKPIKVTAYDDQARERTLIAYHHYENALFPYITMTDNGVVYRYKYCKLIKEEEDTVEMTISEIEQKFNIKNLKIIKEGK